MQENYKNCYLSDVLQLRIPGTRQKANDNPAFLLIIAWSIMFIIFQNKMI